MGPAGQCPLWHACQERPEDAGRFIERMRQAWEKGHRFHARFTLLFEEALATSDPKKRRLLRRLWRQAEKEMDR